MSRRDEALCEELKELATRLGLRVREEILLREVGYRVRSGLCRVRGEDVLFLDRNLTPGERLEVLLGALGGMDIDAHYVSPALRHVLERRGSTAAWAAAVVRARMRLFEQALRERGLKSTAQRDDIARAFFGAGEHLSVEDLHAAVKKVNPRVGYATVYRTLKLLKECGLADERHFDDGQARYEPTEAAEQHHDHIICERCGKIVEFNSDELEKLQERIARFLGFVVSRHRMELYGICAECREGRRSPGRAPRGVQQV